MAKRGIPALAMALLSMSLTMLTGCGSSPSTNASHSSGAGSAPSSDAGDCLLGANGADVEVGIASPTTSCGQWITALAGSGLVWNFIPQMATPGSTGSADSDTMGQACDLTDGTQELYVEDGGGMMYGDAICSREEQNGWTPESSPGPLAAQAQQEAQSQAQTQAQASASAAAQQAQAQLQQDDGTLNSDVAQLDKDLGTWSADVSAANSAYQALLGEPRCDSTGYSDQTTYDDAQNVYDDGSNIYDDENNLTGDINSVNNELSTMQSDAQAAGSEPYGKDISAANAAESKAQAAVTADNSSKIQNEAEAVQTQTDNCTG